MSAVEDICSALFEVRAARTDENVKLARRVRFDVYCREAGYFDPESYPDACETDAYDAHAAESVLFYRPTCAPIGTVRVILPVQDAEDIGRFPFDQLVPEDFRDRLKDLPFDTSAEVSRFCVSRRLREEVDKSPPDVLAAVLGSDRPPAEALREVMRAARIELMYGIVQMSREHALTHLCAVMEPLLLRSLRHLGIHFMRVGPLIEYYGERQPCYAPLDWLLRVMRRERQDIWNVLTDRGRLAV